jgi:two-component system NarL family response regulator
VVATAADGMEAVDRTRVHRPDVVLMDIRMARCDGLAATRLIKAELPETQVVMLTTWADDDDLFEAIRSGASGYLLKSVSGDELVESLAGLRDGVPPLSPGLAARIMREFARRAVAGVRSPAAKGGADPSEAGSSGAGRDTASSAGGPVRGGGSTHPALTARQAEVLRAVAGGHTYKEVAAQLGVSERTVRYHMAEIIDRLHVEHRSQVIAYAGEAGLLDQPAD